MSLVFPIPAPRTSPAPGSPRLVLIFKADRLSAETLRRLVALALPAAVVRMARSVREASDLLQQGVVDLFVTGFNPLAEGDVLGLLGRPAPVRARERILVIIEREEHWLVTALRKFPIHGVFDSEQEEPQGIERAVRIVATGGSYWSASYWTRINRERPGGGGSMVRHLTTTEQIVFALAGAGDDDAAVARVLSLRVSTVATVRRNLHRKLGVQSRGELIRAAAQHGFVQFTAAGVLRPGFTLLASEYQAIRKGWTNDDATDRADAELRALGLPVKRSVESPRGAAHRALTQRPMHRDDRHA